MILIANTPFPEEFEWFSERKSLLANVTDFLDARVQKLFVGFAGVEVNGSINWACLEVIRLDASHVVRVRRPKMILQAPQIGQELFRDGLASFVFCFGLR